MNDPKSIIINLISNSRYYFKEIQNNKILVEWVYYQTTKYANISFKERVYISINPQESPYCANGKKRKFQYLTTGYTYCDKYVTNCICKKTNSTLKRKKTCLKKYGVDSPSKHVDIKEKIKNNLKINNLKKYGVENVFQLDSIKQKSKKTMLKKYGVDCSMKSAHIVASVKENNLKKYGTACTLQHPLVLEKSKKTMIERYGVENAWQSTEINNKRKHTNLKKYGTACTLQHPLVLEKSKKTMIERYGVENAFNSSHIREKIAKTNSERYGYDSFQHAHIQREHFDKLSSTEWLTEKIKCTSATSISQILGVSVTTINNKLHLYGIKPKRQSSAEYALQQFLIDNNIEFIPNTRKIISPLELDIFIPSMNIAIEYCGLYWHSTIYRDQHYHYNKWKQCNNKGIQLITIFEDEWNNSTDICLSRLRHILHMRCRTIGARSLSMKKITNSMSAEFLRNYHMQGNHNGKFNYGAFEGNILRAVMTFSVPRKALSQTNGYELLRFATDGGNYPGVASRLFKQFITDNNPEKIISFCDLRWGNGGIYNILGFSYQYITKPNYWYVNPNQTPLKRHHRYKFTKHNIVNKFGGDPALSESQNMKNMKYLKIYDCGNSKWIWEK